MRADPQLRTPEIERSDFAAALGLAALFVLLFAATQQTRLTGDGAGLATFHALGTGTYYNILYLPICKALAPLTGSDPISAPRFASPLFAGLGIGATWLLARTFGASRFGASVGALLLGVTPSVWFFATTIEIHAIHFGTLALFACATVLAPWRHPALALALIALLFPLLFWTQQTSVTLGPGWVLLVAFARARTGTRWSPKALLFGVGPLLLASLLFAIAVSNQVRFGQFGLSFESQLGQIGDATELREDVPIWWVEWIAPMGLLLPLGLWGLWRERPRGERALAVAGLLLLPLAFFLWWGVPERGGYFLPSAVFIAVAAGWSLRKPSTAGWAIALACVLAQAFLARRSIEAYDQGFVLSERVEIVERLVDEEGLFVSTVEAAPAIAIWLPEVEELNLREFFAQAWLNTGGAADPSFVLSKALPHVERLLLERGQLVMELGYRGESGRKLDTLMRAYADPLVAALRERYSTELHEHASWPMLVVRP